MNTIPIKNIYYLLCYAWDKLEERDKVDVGSIDSTGILDLFGAVIARSMEKVIKQGLDRNYIENEDEVRGIKGKLNLTVTVNKNLLKSKKTFCNYDEFDYNILCNQIIKTTIYKLLKIEDLNKGIYTELKMLYFRLSAIDLIDLKSSDFVKIRLNKMNHHYDMVLKVCRIIHDNIFIEERTGKYCFKDFLRDEKAMARLFESFVRNFYKIEQNNYVVSRERIKWDFESLDSNDMLPEMQTDITLISNSRKIIVDTKYYKEAFKTRFDNEKIQPAHLYQLFSYLKNQEKCSVLSESCDGMLLYPSVNGHFDYKYNHGLHKIIVTSIDLNQDWEKIRKDLIGLIM